MALKFYCQKCGYPTEYTLHVPSFCSHCREAFGQTLEIPKNKPMSPLVARQQPPQDIRGQRKHTVMIDDYVQNREDDDQPEISIEQIENIDKNQLGIDINIDQTRGAFKISDVARGAKVEVQTGKVGKRMSKKEFIEQFRKEASAIKRGEAIEIE